MRLRLTIALLFIAIFGFSQGGIKYGELRNSYLLNDTLVVVSDGTSFDTLNLDEFKEYLEFDDSNLVHKTMTETINGQKTFNDNITVYDSDINMSGFGFEEAQISVDEFYYRNTMLDEGIKFNATEIEFTDGNGLNIGKTKLTPSYISIGNGSYSGYIYSTNLTAQRTYQLPDESGVIALKTDIPPPTINTDTSGTYHASIDMDIDSTNELFDSTYVHERIDSLADIVETDPIYSAWDKDYNDLINVPTLAESNYWTKTGSSLGYNSGSVGIGTTSPSYPLEVRGYSMVRDVVDGGKYIFFNPSGAIQFGSNSGAAIRFSDATSFIIRQGNTNVMRFGKDYGMEVFGNGYFSDNVGIGVTPLYKLDVNGQGNFNGTVKGSDAVLTNEFVTLNQLNNATPTETDPIYTAWDKSTGITITESQITDLAHTIDTDKQKIDTFEVVDNKLIFSIERDEEPFHEVDLTQYVGLWQYKKGFGNADNMAYYPKTVVIGDTVFSSYESYPTLKLDLTINKDAVTAEDARMNLRASGADNKSEIILSNSTSSSYIRKNETTPLVSPTKFHKAGAQIAIENSGEIAIAGDKISFGNKNTLLGDEWMSISDTLKVTVPFKDINGVTNDGTKTLTSDANGIPIWGTSSGNGVFIDTTLFSRNYGYSDKHIHIGNGDIQDGDYNLVIHEYTGSFDTSRVLMKANRTLLEMDAGGDIAYLLNSGYISPEPSGDWWDDYSNTTLFAPYMLNLVGDYTVIGAEDSVSMIIGDYIQHLVPVKDSDGDLNDGTKVMGSYSNGLTNWIEGSDSDNVYGKASYTGDFTSSTTYVTMNLGSFVGENTSLTSDEFTVDNNGVFEIVLKGNCDVSKGLLACQYYDGSTWATIDYNCTISNQLGTEVDNDFNFEWLQELEAGNKIKFIWKSLSSTVSLSYSVATVKKI